MGCDDCREAISAGLDGEVLAAEEVAAAAHLAGCAGCRRFAERAALVTRLARIRVAEPTPDLSAAVLAVAPPVRPVRRRLDVDAVRLALGAVGLAQFGLAVSGMVVDGGAHHGAVELSGASVAHLANESSAWNLAVAVGFVWAAAGGRRISGLLPVLTAFVGVLVTLSVLDAAAGRVEPGRLLTHGLVVIGVALLLVLRRAGGGGDGSERLTGPSDRRTADRSSGPLGPRGDTEGLQPTARHRAA